MDSVRNIAWAVVCSAATLLPNFSSAADDRSERRFQVEAYAREANGFEALASYRLVFGPATPGQLASADASVVTCVHAALAAHGMHEVGAGGAPDVEITVSFEAHARSEAGPPVFRRFRPVTHRVRTLDVPLVDADGKVHKIQQQIALPTDDGYVPSSTARGSVVRFAKTLEIAARTAAAASANRRAGREVWRVSVSNVDEFDDPEAYARMMVAAAMPFIAGNTAGRQTVLLAPDDPRVVVASTTR